MGAVWISEKHAEVLCPGTHGSTFGGNPLACAVGNKILEIIDRDNLEKNANETGHYLVDELTRIQKNHKNIIKAIRGIGLMIGIEMNSEVGSFDKKIPASIQWVSALHEAGLLTIPAGNSIVRFLPALNLKHEEAQAGISLFEQTIKKLTS